MSCQLGHLGRRLPLINTSLQQNRASWLRSGYNAWPRRSHGIGPIYPPQKDPSSQHGVFDKSTSFRCFSSLASVDSHFLTSKPIRILYGSQGGTAQIFGMQLSEVLEQAGRDVTTMGLDEGPPSDMLDPDSLNIILTSVAGVGEPPDNAREWYQHIMSDGASPADNVHFCVFGLGNSKAHPHHFNVIGKRVDERLESLGATRVFDLGLGDDGESIEDDFDVWIEKLNNRLQGTTDDGNPTHARIETENERVPEAEEGASPTTDGGIEVQAAGLAVKSTKYPALILQEPVSSDVSPLPRENLVGTPFYAEDVQALRVQDNRLLNKQAAEYGLREMAIEIEQPYEPGDYFVVYPQNSHCLVEAYLQHVFGAVDPHSVITGSETSDSSTSHPFPIGLTLFETLLHCVDLNAIPSPSVARAVLGRKEINYKQEVAFPRRTLLDLCIETNGTRQSATEDLLYNMTRMQPRHYSIASSPLAHPNHIYLTYRPVKYVTPLGSLREGTCTSHLLSLDQGSYVVGLIRSNPTFRQPVDPKVPVLLLAGGCGVAPVRAFLEDRISKAKTSGTSFGEAHLFLGFRSPHDEVYRELIEEALQVGALTKTHVTYSLGCANCGLVSDAVRRHGEMVWNFMENDGGYVYLCGGARTFGAAIEREVIHIIQQYGPPKMKEEEEAMQYLRDRIAEGRFCEDLAD